MSQETQDVKGHVEIVHPTKGRIWVPRESWPAHQRQGCKLVRPIPEEKHWSLLPEAKKSRGWKGESKATDSSNQE